MSNYEIKINPSSIDPDGTRYVGAVKKMPAVGTGNSVGSASGGGIMFFNVTFNSEDDTYTSDKTYAEIDEVIKNGVLPVCKCGSEIYHLNKYGANNSIRFVYPQEIGAYVMTITKNNTVSISMGE